MFFSENGVGLLVNILMWCIMIGILQTLTHNITIRDDAKNVCLKKKKKKKGREKNVA